MKNLILNWIITLVIIFNFSTAEEPNLKCQLTMTLDEAVAHIPVRTLPAFWITDSKEMKNKLLCIQAGTVRDLTKSAGGRQIYVITYGEQEVQPRSANFNSAIGAHEPSVFCDKEARKKPVILFVGPVHGHETEGVIGLMNFIHVMETGKDLRGRPWEKLQNAGAQCRLVIIPCSNPDGLDRFIPKSLQGMKFEDLRFWGQGTWADGTLCGWPRVKRQHPMKNYGFLGGYFNDNGVNLMHDEFFDPMSTEVKTILDLARNEIPDLTVSLHSHEEAPELLCPAYVPVEVKHRIKALSINYNKKLEACGLKFRNFKLSEEQGDIPPSYNLISAIYHVSGSDVFTFESPHGLADKNFTLFTFDELLDVQLILYQEMLNSALMMKNMK
ncbi:MAG: M14 family zinc carboxypeptidase [Kiritimatiellales bacterium]